MLLTNAVGLVALLQVVEFIDELFVVASHRA
jgi:hypothetical protein